MKRIGLLGGTFDPIHNGHLHAARIAKSHFPLDDVLFIPAYISPMKQSNKPHVSADDRLAMVHLAVDGEFSVYDGEIKHPSVSYTIDTVRKLLSLVDETICYHLILGEDAISRFSHWKEAPSLLELAPPIVVARAGFPKIESMSDEMTLIEAPTVDVSSTKIRTNLESSTCVNSLVPPKVLDYIRAHRLYLPPYEG